MCIAISGVNGEECSTLAEQLLDRYIEYKTHNKFGSDGSFFGNPTVEYAKEEKRRTLQRKADMKDYTIQQKRDYIFHSTKPQSS